MEQNAKTIQVTM